jgi:NADH dehydrogenase/NADH:ubiquinone oxidoreductase subunit G
MSQEVTFLANGKEVRAPAEGSLLVALRSAGIDVPSMCHHDSVQPYGACRLCLVEVETGSHGKTKRKLTTSCNYPVLEGLRVFTDTGKVAARRRVVFELLLAECPEALEVQELAAKYGVTSTRYQHREEDCILCGLCARVCREVVGAEAIEFQGRGGVRQMGTPFTDTAERCTGCGACVYVCPVGCIGLEDRGTRRTIDRWKVQRELVLCRECGGVVGTAAQLQRLRKRVPAEEAIFTRCAECRRKYYAVKVAVEGHM